MQPWKLALLPRFQECSSLSSATQGFPRKVSTQRRVPQGTTPWSAVWETQPWLAVHLCITLFPTGNQCQEPPLQHPLLGRTSQHCSPLQRALLHPCWLSHRQLSHTRDTPLTPQMPPRPPLTSGPVCHCWLQAQSWRSPSCCPQRLGGTLDTAFGIARGGHQGQYLNCKDKRESIRGSFNKGDKRLIDGLINTKPSQGQNSCLSHGSNTETQGAEVKEKKTTGRSKWEQLLNRVTKREKKSTCQWIWDCEECWKGTWDWSKKNGTNARQGWKKMQGRWIALGMPRADGTEHQCRAAGGVRSHCHHQHQPPSMCRF